MECPYQEPYTQPPPHLLKAYTKISSKALQPQKGLLLESHVMLRWIQVVIKMKQFNFSAHYMHQPSVGFWAVPQIPIAQRQLVSSSWCSCPWVRLSLRNVSPGVMGYISVFAPPMLSSPIFHWGALANLRDSEQTSYCFWLGVITGQNGWECCLCVHGKRGLCLLQTPKSWQN